MVIDAFPSSVASFAVQADAALQTVSDGKLVSTDPPYYDNIGYADLSDFFYVWLRRSIRSIFPDLFATLAVPKAEELVATPYRHGNKKKAEAFFLAGMTEAMHRLAEKAHPAFPVTIYYAFKQAESDGADGTASTGWDTFLAAVIKAGFAISGTWPMRTEGSGRMIAKGTNALASSIVLVCRPRAATAPAATRREFITALKAELPQALVHLQRGNIAPVDLAQAAIGPGMAVYTSYAKVLEADGNALSVREALVLINQTLDETLAQQEGDVDADSRLALAWFEQFGFDEGEYGIAEMLSKAKNTSVAGMVEAGILASKGGEGPTAAARGIASMTGTQRPTRAPDRLGDGALTSIRTLEAAGESAAAELRSCPSSAPRPRSPANSATGSTPCVSAKNAPPRRSATTRWCRAGRRSLDWREKSSRPKLNRLRSSQARMHLTAEPSRDSGVAYGNNKSRPGRQGAGFAQSGPGPVCRTRGPRRPGVANIGRPPSARLRGRSRVGEQASP